MRDLPRGIDQRSACRHPDWTGLGDLEIKIEELPEITDWPKPIYVKIGATRTFFAVALAVKAGADVIVLDGMGGRQRRQARRIHRACRDPDPGGSAGGGALAAGARHAPQGAAGRLRRDPLGRRRRQARRWAPTRSRSASRR
jgi:Conserved region in glutamate synthase